ncbi:hypothetical protein BVG16_07910 [Paenibacillus selenitireducens]|uniref:DUF4179 domain-containing protein n=1 Tax=Paenibacillus selenitireducens TaxID=1324314 RepID=A0A1T2XGK4_9BACL|nr:DUF4179 domain-containing protein [Paenibacillus selenitireducens]OPA79021.1 hypothetical protein BVG16_07910 [Paenibacillus selenitireducens]
MDADEKHFFKLMDQMNPESFTSLEDIDIHETGALDIDALSRIKKKTFQTLNHPTLTSQEPTKAIKKKNIWFTGITAAALLILGVGLSLSTNVQAELRNMLQFIPGFGTVQEKSNDNPTYVLERPISVSLETGELTVEGILMQDDYTLINLYGNETERVKELTLVTDTGDVYPFHPSSISSSSALGPWVGTYSINQAIPRSEKSRFTLRIEDRSIGPFKLVPAHTSETLQGLGPSSEHNGIRIVAVQSALAEEHDQIHLLSQLPEGQEVDSYGKKPLAEDINISLMDHQGKNVDILQDADFVKESRLVFQRPSQDVLPLTLTIPSIRVVDRNAKATVTLSIPEQGTAEVNQTLSLAGFPITFTQVHRLSENEVRIYVNMHFDPNQPKTMQYFAIDALKLDGQSYSTHINESSRALEELNLPIQPGRKSLTFYIQDPLILLQGPWVIPLQP